MPKQNDGAYILVRMSYQSPVDGHYLTGEIAVPPSASDEFIEDAFVVFGKVRKIMAKRIVEMLNDPETPTASPTQLPQGNPSAPNRTSQPNGGYKQNKPVVPSVVYTAGQPFETVVNFGKHSGQSLAEIEIEDDSYIDWLYQNGRENQLRSDCNVIITMRGSEEYETAIHGPALDAALQEQEDDQGTFEELVDDDLFPAS